MNKVLLVTDIFPPDIGGPARFIDLLAHALTKRDCTVTVVCGSAAPVEEDQGRPFCVRRISRLHSVFKPRLLWTLFRETLRHDYVLINGLERPAAAVARLCRRRFVIKIVGDRVWETARNSSITTQTIELFQQQATLNKSLSRLDRRRQSALKYAAAVLVPSTYVQTMVCRWGIAPERVVVVPNGISLDAYDQYRPRPRVSDEPLRIVFCGRLTNWKGVDTIVRALQGTTGIQAEIIGDGPEREGLQSLASDFGLDKIVTFSGRLDSATTRARLAQAHVLILDSLYEGLSHTLLEASAIGLALIASACGGNGEIIENGKNGILIPPADVETLRAAIVTLRDDDLLRFRLAHAAKAVSQRFDFKETTRRTVNVLIP